MAQAGEAQKVFKGARRNDAPLQQSFKGCFFNGKTKKFFSLTAKIVSGRKKCCYRRKQREGGG